MASYFMDTYAMIEIIRGNDNYKKYLRENVYTSLFHLYEFYFSILRDFGADIAKEYFLQFRDKFIEITDSDIFEASGFKSEHIKKKLSYADCLGYAMAKERGMKFLTGDNAFESIENVEYVK